MKRSFLNRGASIVLATFALISCDKDCPKPPTPNPLPAPEKPGCSLLLYSQWNFGAPDQEIVGDFNDLKGKPAVYRQVSSLKVVRGTWTLFNDENYRNPAGVVTKGTELSKMPADNELDSGKCTPS